MVDVQDSGELASCRCIRTKPKAFISRMAKWKRAFSFSVQGTFKVDFGTE